MGNGRSEFVAAHWSEFVAARVPDGYSVRAIVGRGIFVGVTNAAGSAMLDFKARGFRMGWALTGRLANARKYTGRGWAERLVDDAVDALRRIEVRPRAGTLDGDVNGEDVCRG